MEIIFGAMFIAVGIYFGMVAIATSIIRGAILLSDRRDLEKEIEKS